MMICSICGDKGYGHQLCRSHYMRWRHHGDPLAGYRPPGLSAKESFRWFMPGEPPEEGCWLWSGNTFHRDGYGMVSFEGVVIGAHVLAYRAFHGEVPEGMEVRHNCDTPPCVHPLHVLAGTHMQNVADMLERERGHEKLSNDQIREIRRIYASGMIQQKDIAEQYGVSRSSISRVLDGSQRAHVS